MCALVYIEYDSNVLYVNVKYCKMEDIQPWWKVNTRLLVNRCCLCCCSCCCFRNCWCRCFLCLFNNFIYFGSKFRASLFKRAIATHQAWLMNGWFDWTEKGRRSRSRRKSIFDCSMLMLEENGDVTQNPCVIQFNYIFFGWHPLLESLFSLM